MTTEKTTADELRTAAAKLRQAAQGATDGPWRRADDDDLGDSYPPNFLANWDGPYLQGIAEFGDGDQAERDSRWATLAHPGIAEPLASWLESAAWVAGEHPQDPDYAGLPDTTFCKTCNDEETTCVSYIAGALAVARMLNGGAA